MDENEARMNAGDAGAATQESNEQQAQSPETAEREAQSRFNAQMSSARKSGRAEAEKEMDRRIAALGRTNPATGRAMETMEDVFAYFDAQQRSEDEAEAKKTGKSVESVSADRKARQIGKAQMAAEQAAKAERQRMDEEIGEFMSTYPEVDLGKLLKGPFKDYLDELGEGVNLTRAYRSYSRMTEKQKKAESAESKAERSTGGGGVAKPSKLSAAQRQMMDEWNSSNPGMRMSEEEFASRLM